MKGSIPNHGSGFSHWPRTSFSFTCSLQIFFPPQKNFTPSSTTSCTMPSFYSKRRWRSSCLDVSVLNYIASWALILTLVYWDNHRGDMQDLVRYILLPVHGSPYTQLWAFVSTFRSRCKTVVRAIVNARFEARILPDLANFEAGHNQQEYQLNIQHNVAAFTNRSCFHKDGFNEQVSFLRFPFILYAKKCS